MKTVSAIGVKSARGLGWKSRTGISGFLLLLVLLAPARQDSPLGPGASISLAAQIQDGQSQPRKQAQATDKDDVRGERAVHQGISVEFWSRPLGPRSSESRRLVENEQVEWRFKITDAPTGTPVKGGHPAAWLDLKDNSDHEDPDACSKRITSYLNAGIVGPHPIDLNSYYVTSLNQDSSITVVDPRFGYGGTKLLAMLVLASPGFDWALTYDQNALFVSEPDLNQIEVADTASWKLMAAIPTGPRPGRLALQPDEHYLWVGYTGTSGAAGDSGVSVISTTSLEEVARIPTGRGSHDIAFSNNGQYAFLTNSDAGTVTVIDVRTLKKIRDVAVGVRPGSIAFSSASGAAYVTSAGDGMIAAIRGDRPEVVRITSDPGLGQIKFAPGGRFGFIVNAGRGRVYVLDSSNNRIIQTAAIDAAPDQISFSKTLAYIRRSKSETVLMIPLASAGMEGQALSVADFPGGQHVFGAVTRPSAADSIVQVPNENAVLVANPADKSIYYYMEGMAAPMGNFSNYGREARAVLVVDRSLREREPGVYSAVAKLRGPGTYELAFMLDSPRAVHCFQVKVDPDPDLEAKRNKRAVTIEPVARGLVMTVGKTTSVGFKIIDSKTGEPIPGVKDIQALAMLAPGTWQHRQLARETSTGIYSVEFTPPRPGIYYIYLASQGLAMPLASGKYLTLEARSDAASPQQR